MDLYQRRRIKMVEGQVRARGITHPDVLSAMARIPRHLFVDEGLADQAYGDTALPISGGQTISQPYIVALMTQSLEVKPSDRVLEIGTGSGYQTAILANLVERVFSIERLSSLASDARKCLDSLGYFNVAIRVGDGTYGWREEGPFDGVIVTAGSPVVPRYLIEQLSIGGKIVIPVGDHQVQSLLRITRMSEDPTELKEEKLTTCRFVDLIGDHAWKP